MIAFATLGCPGLRLPEVIDLATTNGCTGIEFRYADGEPVHPGLSTSELAAVRDRLAAAGLTALALDSYIRVAAEGDDAEVMAELRRHLAAAVAVGAPYVRVFPGGGEPSPGADERAVRRLAAVADAAVDAGVGVLLETHDSHRRAEDAVRVVAAATERAGVSTSDGVPLGAIWDVLHTWLGGETPAASAALVAPWLGYVQLKDVPSAEDGTPVPLGAGVLPLDEVLAQLHRRGYAGPVSLEWERAWHPEAAPLADVLPGYVELVRTAETPATG
ncbi:sugar phosphate isomerase/epimerase family protein [Actinocatenispora sera]|uniref:sugar phosphate isomerase/epimerase family protein n=1 Tax=Actinocatenispora sera TaxID=390989 RepID=UPI003402438F